MAKYTFELRRLFDLYTRETVEGWFKNYELSDYLTSGEIAVINERGTWSKDKHATKIVDHYYIREIGFETPYLFKHYVEITMKEIMKRKLPLIYSASIEYDPLVNVDYTETYNRSIEDTQNKDFANSQSGSDSTTVTSSGLTVNSDTPQGQISKTTILEGRYATSTSAGESTSTTSNTNSTSGTSSEDTTGTSEEESTKHVKGNSGVSATAQKMIQQYRENIIAIDTDIINELNNLFMGLW